MKITISPKLAAMVSPDLREFTSPGDRWCCACGAECRKAEQVWGVRVAARLDVVCVRCVERFNGPPDDLAVCPRCSGSYSWRAHVGQCPFCRHDSLEGLAERIVLALTPAAGSKLS